MPQPASPHYPSHIAELLGVGKRRLHLLEGPGLHDLPSPAPGSGDELLFQRQEHVVADAAVVPGQDHAQSGRGDSLEAGGRLVLAGVFSYISPQRLRYDVFFLMCHWWWFVLVVSLLMVVVFVIIFRRPGVGRCGFSRLSGRESCYLWPCRRARATGLPDPGCISASGGAPRGRFHARHPSGA